MRRPGPRLIAPRAVPGDDGGLSPAPLSSPLLVGPAPPLTPVWQQWLTALREAVTGLQAGGGGGGGGDADTLDGLDSTDFLRKPMPLADLPPHAPTHGGGGSDPLPYVDLPEAAPASPPADHARLFALDVNGFTQVEMRDSAGKGARFAADNIVIAKVTEPAGVTRGQVLYIAGASGANSLVRLARANDITTMPGIGLALDTGALNAFVRVLITGTLQQLNTAAWVEGAALFVSATTAGALTATPPLAPDFTQRLGFVTRSHATAGETLVLSTGVVTPPRLHATTHSSGGTDPVTVTALAGYPGGTTNYLRADGTFATPPDGGGGIPALHHATHEPGGSDALVNAAWTNQANTFTPNQTMAAALTVGGVLTVTGVGTHIFGAGSGYVTVGIDGGGVADAGPVLIFRRNAVDKAYIGTHSGISSGASDALMLLSPAAEGIEILAAHVSGAIRFYSGGATERMQITASGQLCINTGAAVFGCLQTISYNGNLVGALALSDSADGISSGFLYCCLGSSTVIGSITRVGATSAVAFNTTSDQRLKTDRGAAQDLTALRGVVVHDFVWTEGNVLDRGIFAQEAHAIFPRAITVGSDGDDLSRPWMTDYSKFVPDLIVGWQQHDADIHALKALLKDFHV